MKNSKAKQLLILITILPGTQVMGFSGNMTPDLDDTSAPSNCSWDLGFLEVFLAGLGILGVVCNSLVFITLLSGYMHRGSHSAHLFANLAFVDTFLSAFLVFPFIGKVISQHYPSQSVSQTACSVWLSGVLVFAAASVYTVTAVSLDRHMGILHPLRRAILVKSHGTFKRITGVWVLALAISTPLWSGWLHSRVPTCTSVLQCRYYQPMWYFTSAAVLIYFCPLCIMTASYYRVHRTIRRRYKVMSMGGVATGGVASSGSVPKGGWALRVHVGTPRVSIQTNPTIEEDFHSKHTEKKVSISSRQIEKKVSLSSRHTEKWTSTTTDRAEISIPKSPSSAEKSSFANTSTSQTGTQGSIQSTSQTYISNIGEPPKGIPPEHQASSNSSQSVTWRVKKVFSTSRETGKDSPQASRATNTTYQSLILNQPPHSSTTDSSPHKLRRSEQVSNLTPKRATRASRFFTRRGTWTDTNSEISKKFCQGLTKTTVILMMIMFLFVLFWMPFFALLPICHVGGGEILRGVDIDWCTISHWWALLHSLTNPFIYVWIRADYRRATRCLVSCKPRRDTNFLRTAGSPLTFSPTDPRAGTP